MKRESCERIERRRALYHERWELELGYDALKTVMLDRQETIRSKSPHTWLPKNCSACLWATTWFGSSTVAHRREQHLWLATRPLITYRPHLPNRRQVWVFLAGFRTNVQFHQRVTGTDLVDDPVTQIFFARVSQ